ncbi:ATP-binding cassette domain-containing protein [Acidomonas methanolica]|uniref:ATP-binding cassette domain-containing protein n=1 Tax=Acidomonas methanolica TaxID=437 RepID=UPI002119E4E1
MSGVEAAFSGRISGKMLDVALAVPAAGVTALVGPSGAGKTTVLRAMAGLHRFAQGRCVVNGVIWQDDSVFLPPWRRGTGYVFQESALFPHLDVRRNLLYGARAGGLDEIAALLDLAPLLGRGVKALSGGERQRVALGRALLSRPVLMLMDEPLSALDHAARDRVLARLRPFLAARGLPALYVTHDPAERAAIADREVVL